MFKTYKINRKIGRLAGLDTFLAPMSAPADIGALLKQNKISVSARPNKKSPQGETSHRKAKPCVNLVRKAPPQGETLRYDDSARFRLAGVGGC